MGKQQSKCVKFQLYKMNKFQRSTVHWGFPCGSMVKNLPASEGGAGGVGLIPGSGSSPGGKTGNLLHYSCLRNPMNRGTWRAAVQGAAKSQTRFSN